MRLVRAILGSAAQSDASRPCDFARTESRARTAWATFRSIRRASREGTQSLVLQAEDAAGNPANSSAVTARVDNTAPGAVQVALEGGEAWRNRNDFDVLGQPETRATARRSRWRITGSAARATAECVDAARSPGRDHATRRPGGAGTGRMAAAALARGRRRQQGTRERFGSGRAAVRPRPPQLGFEPSPPSDPTAVSVRVTDSDVRACRRTDRTQPRGHRHLAHAADARRRRTTRCRGSMTQAFAPGTYLLRATARDQAGNQNSTDRRLDGAPMTVILPLRVPTSAGRLRRSRESVRRTIRRGGRRRTVRHRVESLRTDALGSRFGGQHAGPRGRSRTLPGSRSRRRDSGALAQPDRARNSWWVLSQTDAQGRFTYVAPGDSSRTLRFVYNGTPVTLPAQREVTLLVRAASTIRVNRRRLLNGQAVRFAGRVRSLPTPPAGKLVELQVVLSGRWQTFRTTTTTPTDRGACSTASGAAADSSATASEPAFPPKPATRSKPGAPESSRCGCGDGRADEQRRAQLPRLRQGPRHSFVPLRDSAPRVTGSLYGKRPRIGGLVIDRLRRHFTYANVMATLAVFIALGGSSYAALNITGRDVKDGSLTHRELKRNTLGGTQDQGIATRQGPARAERRSAQRL